jgi:hypothetical protein
MFGIHQIVRYLTLYVSRLFGAAQHVVDEGTVDVGATDADGIEEVIVIRHKVPVVG